MQPRSFLFLIAILLVVYSILQFSYQTGVGVNFSHGFVSVATMKEDQLMSISSGQGDKLGTPDCLAFMENGDVLFGEQALSAKTNRVDKIRFLLEHKFDELSNDFVASYPSKLVQDHFGYPVIELQFNNGSTQLLDPLEAFSILVFEKSKESAEEFLQETITRMIVSIPLRISKYQRERLLNIAPKDVETKMLSEEFLSIKGYDLSHKDSQILVLNWNEYELQSYVVKVVDENIQILFDISNEKIGLKEFDTLFEKYWIQNNNGFIDFKELRCNLKKKQPVYVSIPSNGDSNEKEITLEEYVQVSSTLLANFNEFLHKIIEIYPPSQIDKIILLNSTCSFPTIPSMVEHLFHNHPLNSIQDPILLGATKLSKINQTQQPKQETSETTENFSPHDEL